MKSREPVLVHGRDYWDRANLPHDEFRDRVGSIRSRMAERDVDALLVYGRGDRDGHLCYVSNLVNKVPNWGLLVAITPDAVAVRNERSSRTRPVLERGTWIEDIRFRDDIVEDLDELLGGIETGATLGTAGFGAMPHGQRTRFEAGAADYDVVRFDEAMWDLRASKSEREFDQVTRAGRILEGVFDTLEPERRLPAVETALATHADYVARLRGAQDFRFLVGNPGETEGHLRPAEHHRIDGETPLAVYAAVRYEGYWAECGRTYPLGGDESTVEEARRIYDESVAAVRPGTDVTTLVEEVRSGLENSELDLASEYTFGGGIGVGIDEQPSLDVSTTAELSDGMALSVRLALEAGDGAIVLFNDTLALRNGETQILTDRP